MTQTYDAILVLLKNNEDKNRLLMVNYEGKEWAR